MAKITAKKKMLVGTAGLLKDTYSLLLKRYGPQGWWPILAHDGTNPTKAGSINGYHVGDYSFPKDTSQQFEICAGAVLTQNTGWPSVEKALMNLDRAGILDAKRISEASPEKIKQLIRPAGYFNQKTAYLKNFADFFIRINKTGHIPSREEVLHVKGIGNETADSILLYAFRQPEFVIDAYTRRIFSRIGIIDPRAAYVDVKKMFESNLKKDVKLFQEYHALIVEHAKRHCTTTPKCDGCPLTEVCKKRF